MENEANLPPVQTPAPAVQTPAPPLVVAFDPRRRIRELLSIPERDRTDAEWDELNELEIQTAPGNRVGNQVANNAGYTGNPGNSGKPGFHGKNRKGKGGGQGRPQHAQSKPNNPNNPNKPRPDRPA